MDRIAALQQISEIIEDNGRKIITSMPSYGGERLSMSEKEAVSGAMYPVKNIMAMTFSFWVMACQNVRL